MARKVTEDEALRDLMEAIKEHAAARNWLWGLGVSGREKHSPHYAARLDCCEQTIRRVCDAVRIAEEAAKSRKRPGRYGGAEVGATKTMPLLYDGNVISPEEFRILLGNPPP